jgi:K+-sensing histidine kinase KdpD
MVAFVRGSKQPARPRPATLNFPLGAHEPLFEGSWNRICCVVRQHGAVVGVVLTLLLCCIVSPQLNARFGDVGMRAVAVSFPLGMILVAVRFGIGPAVVTAGLGAFALNHVFVQPLFASAVHSVRDRVTMGLIGASAAAAAAYAERLRRRASSARRETEIEGLRNELLSALSDDLRAPLAALVTAGRALLEDELAFSARHDLSDVVFTETARLHRTVVTILELARLEAGHPARRHDLQAIDEIIGSALYRLEDPLCHRTVRTRVSVELPLTTFDPVLIEHVLIDVIEHVVRHAAPDGPIDISAGVENTLIVVEVTSPRRSDVASLWESMLLGRLLRWTARRARGRPTRERWLDLSRVILAVHDGWIRADAWAHEGACVRFALPIRGDEATVEELSLEALAPSAQRIG